MKAFRNSIFALAAGGLLMAGGAQAASNLLGSLSDAANQQLSGNSSTATTSGGYSASQLTSLLGGSSSKLTADSSTNAAGILQYCVKNKVLSATSATSVKDKLMSKLGVQNDTTTQKADYQDGINGILHTGTGQSLDLNSLGAGTGGLTQIKEKVKTKACNVVLKQSKSLL